MEQAGIVGGLIIVGGIIGSIVIPAISDRIRRRKPFAIINLAVAAPMLFLLVQTTDFTFLVAAGFVLGFFLMSALPIGLEMSAELSGSAMAGSASSFLWLLGEVGSVAFILGMESIKSITGAWYDSVVVLLILELIALALCFLLTETWRKPAT
jgi:sugar phosphate permease